MNAPPKKSAIMDKVINKLFKRAQRWVKQQSAPENLQDAADLMELAWVAGYTACHRDMEKATK